MKRYSRKKPEQQSEIARERMRILFRKAGEEFGAHPELSDRYVSLARKIGMKYNEPVPKDLKARFCRKCGRFLVFGRNAKHRVDSRNHCVTVTCAGCGNRRRVPYVRELKEKRAKNLRGTKAKSPAPKAVKNAVKSTV